MNYDPPENPNPTRGSRGKLVFFLMALAPIPLGLIAFTVVAHSNSLDQNPLGPMMVTGAALSLIFCVIGSVGMLGGFDGEARIKAWLGGIALGIILFVVEVIVVLFVGCATLIGTAR